MSAIYAKFKRALLKRQLAADITTLDLRLIAIDEADYTVDSGTHEFLSDIPAAARVSTSGQLQNVTVSEAGVLDADNITLTGVSGDTVEAVAVYIHTGVEATSRLLVYINGLTLTPDGGNVDVTINSILQL